jgi:hypothetical protein
MEEQKKKEESSKRSSVLSVNAVSENQLIIQVNTQKSIQANPNQQSQPRISPSLNQLSGQSISQTNTQPTNNQVQGKPLSVIVSNCQLESGVISRHNSGLKEKREESSSMSRKASRSPGRISITCGNQSKIIYEGGVR